MEKEADRASVIAGFSVAPTGDIFDPETVDAYEVGLKGGLFDRRPNFSLAGFLSDYDDLQGIDRTTYALSDRLLSFAFQFSVRN